MNDSFKSIDRRQFLTIAGTGLAAGLSGCGGLSVGGYQLIPVPQPPETFEISLAEWSLHRTLRKGEMTNLDFPRVTREKFGLDAVEYVNSFFKDKAQDEAYLMDLRQRCEDHGVKSLLIMCDGEGNLGDPDNTARTRAIKNHHRWIDAAKFLGCHSIRVNAASSGSYEEQMRLAADGLSRLTEYGASQGLNVIVENHGGLSSNGAWLAGVMKLVNHPRCGTLPDFGNFNLGNGKTYDRYQGIEELMPFAKAVSAKSHEFDENGSEVHTDYRRMMRLVRDAGYRGYVGIEFEGAGDEAEGILATKRLLERERDRWWQDDEIKKS
ncbi:MAG: sugar phosphate isomerase/epimerase [Planctomycetes bacterium]|nr:sugar phosphate isomerase/epimerase [Planctomycetota bacterium]